MSRRLGQHFLNRPDIAARIAAAAGIRPGDEVVEVGPGTGALTRALLDAGARVTAVEKDAGLAARLGKALASFQPGSLRVLRADFLELPPAELPPEPVFAANLPFDAAGPILRRILRVPGWRRAVLMFQAEVARRIVAGPGSRAYGVLSVDTALRAEAGLIMEVPAAAFSPRPKVDAAVVRFAPARTPGLDDMEDERVLAAARAAFGHRRKTAANSLSLGLGIGRAQAEEALARAGVRPGSRAEHITVAQFIALARLI